METRRQQGFCSHIDFSTLMRRGYVAVLIPVYFMFGRRLMQPTQLSCKMMPGMRFGSVHSAAQGTPPHFVVNAMYCCAECVDPRTRVVQLECTYLVFRCVLRMDELEVDWALLGTSLKEGKSGLKSGILGRKVARCARTSRTFPSALLPRT